MNKIFKKIVTAGLVTASVASIGLFAACGNGGENYQVFEAEYTDVENIQGGGWSGSPDGKGVIVRDNASLGASNGYYIPYTWVDGFTLTFEISAVEATTAKMVVRLSSEFEGIVLTPAAFEVNVNGQSLDYGSFTLPDGVVGTAGAFVDFTVSDAVSLNQGPNTVKLIVHENDLVSGRNIGPAIDCIKFDTQVRLSMYNFTDNTVVD